MNTKFIPRKKKCFSFPEDFRDWKKIRSINGFKHLDQHSLEYFKIERKFIFHKEKELIELTFKRFGWKSQKLILFTIIINQVFFILLLLFSRFDLNKSNINGAFVVIVEMFISNDTSSVRYQNRNTSCFS